MSMEPDAAALENAVLLAAHRANNRFGSRAASGVVAEAIAVAAADAMADYLAPFQEAANANILLMNEQMQQVAAQMERAKAEGKSVR